LKIIDLHSNNLPLPTSRIFQASEYSSLHHLKEPYAN